MDNDTTIIIRHNHADGTVIEGSSKGDGVDEIAKQHGFTWRPAGIHIRNSRDKDAKTWKINAAAEALRADGHTVTVEVDNTPRPIAVREADRVERAGRRAERLTERAEKAAARSEAARAKVLAITDHIPLGQPILIGHHSEGRARRDQERIHNGTNRAFEEGRRAGELARRAESAASSQDHRENPRVTMRRIERLEVEARDVARNLAGYRNNRGDVFAPATPGSDYHDRLTRRAATLDEEIQHWKKLLDEHADAGTFVPWGPEHFRKGDQARVTGHWYPVVRVNKKSLSVTREKWRSQETAPWDQITGWRRDGEQLDTPNGEPWPVVLAVKVARWRDLLTPSARHFSLNSPERKAANHVQWARRLVHGLDLGASENEVDAFHPLRTTDDVAASRALAAAYVDMYDRLEAGDRPADIRAAGPTWTGQEPTWRMPAGDPERRQIRDLRVGDIIQGTYDGPAGLVITRYFAGPVDKVIPHRGDEYSGERFVGYWTIRLTDGSERLFRPYSWVAVFPAAASSRVEPGVQTSVENVDVADMDMDMDVDVVDVDVAGEVDPWTRLLENLDELAAIGREL